MKIFISFCLLANLVLASEAWSSSALFHTVDNVVVTREINSKTYVYGVGSYDLDGNYGGPVNLVGKFDHDGTPISDYCTDLALTAASYELRFILYGKARIVRTGHPRQVELYFHELTGCELLRGLKE